MLIQDLKAAIASGDAIIVAGAGVSLAATDGAKTASWTGLLRHGVDYCKEYRKISEPSAKRAREDIDGGDLVEILSAAEKISTWLKAPSGGEYLAWLRASVGCLQPVKPDVVEALADLKIPIATTNYDDILSTVTKYPPVTWMDNTKFQRVLRGDDKGILHIHGHWERPESVILGIRSYDRILNDGVQQALQQAAAVFKSLIFVGFGEGLQDPNFGSLLQWLTGFARADYRHFRLAMESEVDIRQAEHPPEQRVSVLSYGKRREDLAAFLKELAPGKTAPDVSPDKQALMPDTVQPTPALPPRKVCLGRTVELESVVQAFLASEGRPVSVRGAPGIGKTTVVLAALHDSRVADRFGDRRYFVRCDGHVNRESLVVEIARILRISRDGDSENKCIKFLESGPGCLVLDNFETTWDADTLGTEELLARLAAIPTLVFCVTARIRGQPAGFLWQEPVEIFPLKPGEDRTLFLSTAGTRHGSDPDLEKILNVADGVPLVLLLLGHLAEAEPDLSNLWARWLSESTHLLSRGQGNSPQLSAAVSFELSLHGPRMTVASRRALSVLAALPGGLAHRDIPACLPGSMAEISILRSTGLVYDEGGRLRILAPIREYVVDMRLPYSPALNAVQEFFLELAKVNSGSIRKIGGVEAIRRLAMETLNIETMISAALDGNSPARAISVATRFGNFVATTGMGSESTIFKARQIALRIGDKGAEAECCLALGKIAYYRSKNGTAEARCLEGLGLFRETCNVRGQADCFQKLGEIALNISDLKNANLRFNEALLMFRLAGSLTGQAHCLRGLGDIALQMSRHPEAISYFEDARHLFRQAADVHGEANCIEALGDLLHDQSETSESMVKYEEARQLYWNIGDELGVANCLMSMGEIHLADSLLPEARSRFEEARKLYDQIGDTLGKANCCKGLGRVSFAESAPGQAKQWYAEALALYQSIPEPYSSGCIQEDLADMEEDRTKRLYYLRAAAKAWKSNERDDLVRIMLKNFKLTESDLLQAPDAEPETGLIKSPA